MGLCRTEESIAIESVSACCDFCNRCFQSVNTFLKQSDANEQGVRLKFVGIPQMIYGPATGLYKLVGYIEDMEQFLKHFEYAGWIVEWIHGKQFVLCPQCKAKEEQQK